MPPTTVKIYQYDDKHQTILSVLDVGWPTKEGMRDLEATVKWLNETAFTSRYRKAILASGVQVVYDEEDDYTTLEFEHDESLFGNLLPLRE